jgi:hypothetical protein
MYFNLLLPAIKKQSQKCPTPYQQTRATIIQAIKDNTNKCDIEVEFWHVPDCPVVEGGRGAESDDDIVTITDSLV